MSPTPDTPPSLWLDAAISASLGVASGAVRWLLSPDRHTLGCVVRHILVASVTSAFAGLAVSDLIDSEGLRFACAGAAGYAAPEIWDWLMALLRKRAEKAIGKE